jgi:hypothetical protein
MREQKRKEAAPSGYEPASAWRDELLTNAFELWLGISRLLAAVQNGPPQAPPPRNRRPVRPSR